MALEKTLTFKGFDATYWRINDMHLDRLASTTRVVVSLYKDRTTRLAEPGSYIAQEAFILAAFPTLNEQVSAFVTRCYNELKTLPAFTGATDVLE